MGPAQLSSHTLETSQGERSALSILTGAAGSPGASLLPSRPVSWEGGPWQAPLTQAGRSAALTSSRRPPARLCGVLALL